MNVEQYRMGVAVTPKKQRGHTAPRVPLVSLDQPGRLRVAHLLCLLGISHSTLYCGIKSGRYPARDGIDNRIPYWKTETIRLFLNK